MSLNGLPENWEVKKLADVCETILGGGTPTTSKPEYWDGSIPWISSADVYGLKDIRPRRTITEKGLKESTTNLLPEGGIIVVTRVGLGKIAIAPYDLCFSQDSQGLILDEKVILKAYALLCLSRAVQRFKHESRGTTISGVTKRQLNEVNVPLPPIDEQERIVAKIEELFSELDAGVESLKKAQAQLKTYRQAVLKSAFEGKLAKAGLSEGELTDEHKTVPIGEFVGCIVPNRDKPKSFTGDIPWLTTPDLDNDSISIDYSKIELGLTEDEAILYNARVIPPNSVIMTCVGKFGVSAIVTKPTVANQQLHAFLPSKEFLPKYIAYNIKAQLSYFEKSSTSTTIAYLNKANCNGMPIRLCSIEKQAELVEEIESRLSVCDKLEETIAASLKQSEALRQSILKQAFEGKLVKTDEQ